MTSFRPPPSNGEGDEEDLSLSLSDYARHAWYLIVPHVVLVVLALLCVLLRNSAGVLLPNYTGQILDAVIRGSKPDFQVTLIDLGVKKSRC